MCRTSRIGRNCANSAPRRGRSNGGKIQEESKQMRNLKLDMTTLRRVACAALLYAPCVTHAQPLPQDGGNVHNGVASCAGSTCHGAVRQFTDSNILHNEFITWTREDRHAK